MRPLLFPVFLSLALAAAAQPTRPPELPAHRKTDSHSAVERWKEEIRAADQLLRDGQWRPGRQKVDALIATIGDRLEGGEGAGAILAPAVMLRAIARAAEGDRAGAGWDWAMVRNLDARFSHPNLALYGPAAQNLDFAQLEERFQGETKLPRLQFQTGASADSAKSAVPMHPVKVGGQPPRFPEAWHHLCRDGEVVVDSVIGEDGSVGFPHAQKGEAPALYAAMEALRDWKFRPATLGGKPLTVLYTVTTRFECSRGR